MKTEIKLETQSGCMKLIFIFTYVCAFIMMPLCLWIFIEGIKDGNTSIFWLVFFVGLLGFIWYLKIFIFPFSYLVDTKQKECSLHWKGIKVYKLKTTSIKQIEIKHHKIQQRSGNSTIELHNFVLRAVLKSGKQKKMLLNHDLYGDPAEALSYGHSLAQKIIAATQMPITIVYKDWSDEAMQQLQSGTIYAHSMEV